MTKYIDLDIVLDGDNKELTSLTSLIIENKLVVLLGAPGSGKSSILKKYLDENSDDTELLTVKDIIKYDKKPNETTKVLLVDGLDEHRSISTDKYDVSKELGTHLNGLCNRCRVVISCRELDWYGEDDKAALSEELNSKACIGYIKSLDIKKQREIAIIIGVEDIDEFIERFSGDGLLSNPQMLTMLAKLYMQDNKIGVHSKTELYDNFLLLSKDHKNQNKHNDVNQLTPTQIYKYVGYFAYYYFFVTEIESFKEDVIEQICDDEKGYSKTDLIVALSLKVFDNKQFSHRTIAEYALAKFFVKFVIEDKENPTDFSISRIKRLFVYNNRVPTEVRNVFLWIGSLTQDEQFLTVDPCHQLVYGDNSLLTLELKKQVLESAIQYICDNPSFIVQNRKNVFSGLYCSELDDYIIELIKTSFDQNFRVFHFLYSILDASSSQLSESIKEKIAEIIDPEILNASHIAYLIDLIPDNIELYQKILNVAYSSSSPERLQFDPLLDKLLRVLYPRYISSRDIIDYFQYYNDNIGGYGWCLFDTPAENMAGLVYQLHEKYYNTESQEWMVMKYFLKRFVSDYLLQTVLQYRENVSAEIIYDEIIKLHKTFYKSYKKFEYESYRGNSDNIINQNKEKLQILVDRLFEKFVQDNIDEKLYLHLYCFTEVFSFATPSNKENVILSSLDMVKDDTARSEFFFAAFCESNRDHDAIKRYKSLAQKYNILENFERYLNPPKNNWEKRNEAKEEKIKKEIADRIKKNEESIPKGISEIENNGSLLHYVSTIVQFHSENWSDYFTEKTYNMLKEALKNCIFRKYDDFVYRKYLTLESLVENSPKALRGVDVLYYTSCALNNNIIDEKLEAITPEVNEYLYTISLLLKFYSYQKNNYFETHDRMQPELSKEIIRKYLVMLSAKYYPDICEIINISVEKEDDLSILQLLVNGLDPNYPKTTYEFIKRYLEIYGFELTNENLTNIKEVIRNETVTLILDSLICIHNNDKAGFSQNMAIELKELIVNYENIPSRGFSNLSSSKKVRVISFMMNQYPINTFIHKSGECWHVTPSEDCFKFLGSVALKILSKNELINLFKSQKHDSNIWKDEIKSQIVSIEQKGADSNFSVSKANIENAKNFILSGSALTKKDFFILICQRINILKTKIQSNRDNDKFTFYNMEEDKRAAKIRSNKSENLCRDIIYQRLKDSYADITFIKEQYEGEDRVDIGIKYNNNIARNFEVQVECKLDSNPKLLSGVNEQLVAKYFNEVIEYGVYLVFVFKPETDVRNLTRDIRKNIPDEYLDKVDVVCIDLRLG